MWMAMMSYGERRVDEKERRVTINGWSFPSGY